MPPWTGGIYSLPTSLSSYASAGGGVDVSVISSLFADLETGLNAARTNDGSNTPTTDLPMGGFVHTEVGAPSSTNQYMRVAEQIKSWPVYMLDAAAVDASTSISGVLGLSADTQASLSGAILQIAVVSAKPVTTPVTMSLHVGDASVYLLTDPRGNALLPGAFIPGVPMDVYLSGAYARVKQPYVTHFKVTATLTTSGVGLSADPEIIFELSKIGDMCMIRVNLTTDINIVSGATSRVNVSTSTSPIPAAMIPAAAQNVGHTHYVQDVSVNHISDMRITTGGGVRFEGSVMVCASANLSPVSGFWFIASAGS